LNFHAKLLMATDRLMAVAVVALVFGSALSFGGAVWWFRPAVAATTFVLVATKLAQQCLAGRVPILKSPLFVLGLLALGLGMLQILPLPPSLARRLSPTAHEVYSFGNLPALARSDLTTARLDEPASVRSPATLDRAATLHWLVGAAVCLGVFWSVTHFADRLGRLYLVWGSVVAAFVLNAALGVVQIMGHADGLYGFLQPGRAPIWAPSADDVLESPSTAVLRRLATPATPDGQPPAFERTVLVPEVPFLLGTMVGGSGAFLALGSLAVPLALAIVLHVTAPRGSRESLAFRLKHTGQGGLAGLLVVMLVAGTFLVGLMAGPWFCAPFALGLVVVGFPRAAGSRWLSFGLTTLLILSLGAGAALAVYWPAVMAGRPPVTPPAWDFVRLVWTESAPILRDFPVVGTGLGSFPTIYPYMKTQDVTSTTAMSSLLQYAVESGALGLALLAMAALWCVVRLPAAVGKVGLADRSLAYGLIGAALSFSLWFVVHWTIELPAIAISASALGGTWNRFLTGGTDLFVERG
jgi:hypothetical protein